MNSTSPIHQRSASSPRSPTSPLVPLERRPCPSSVAATAAGLPTMADVVLGPPLSVSPSNPSGPLPPVGVRPIADGPRRASASSLPTPRFTPSTPPNRPTPLPGQLGPTPSTPSLRVGDAIDAQGAPRNIVILLDGTGNQFSAKNSNVIKMLSVLEADETQLLYYSSGVGTVLPDHASTWGKIRAGIAETTDKMLAWNHTDFLCNAYKYLMDYYRAGDKVYIFGFSRGAYTARALAGMIQKVGLLPPGNHNQIKLAYEVYITPATVKMRGRMAMNMQEDPAVMYRQIFGISRAVRIEFLGVWDTVSSLGGIFLPRNVKSVKFFRQALALDERRVRFAPEYRYLFNHEIPCETAEAKATLLQARDAYKRLHSASCAPQERYDAREELKGLLDADHPCVAITDPIPTVSAGEGGLKQKIWKKNKEVWFMGCHSDVGGGNDVNMKESLSNIPFRWMLREAVRCGVKLEPAGIALQPALYNSELVHAQGLIPPELIKILKDELRGEVIEFDNEHRVKSIIEQTLPYSRLVEIVELAAAYDTAMDNKDSIDGSPMGADACKDVKESLTAWWAPLEVTLLQTRRYGGGLGADRDVWRLNLGRGRQIVPGQAIHRSVLKRLRHDRPVGTGDESGLERIKSALGIDDNCCSTDRAPSTSATPAAPGQTAHAETGPNTARDPLPTKTSAAVEQEGINSDGVPEPPTDIRVSPASTPTPDSMLAEGAAADAAVTAAPAKPPVFEEKPGATGKGRFSIDKKSSTTSSSSSGSPASSLPATFDDPAAPPSKHAVPSAMQTNSKEEGGSKVQVKGKGKKKGLFKVGDSAQSLRSVRTGKEKKVYEEPKAVLPEEWGTDWEALRLGRGPAIWED